MFEPLLSVLNMKNNVSCIVYELIRDFTCILQHTALYLFTTCNRKKVSSGGNKYVRFILHRTIPVKIFRKKEQFVTVITFHIKILNYIAFR